jgi:tetratricopeptide (TPR) repeat protein
LEFAFDLKKEGDYFRAITEFKRAEALSNSACVKALARFHVAESLFATGDWVTARMEYTRVKESYPDTRWVERAGFMRSVSIFNLGDYAACRSAMEVFKGRGRAKDLSDEAFFVSGLSYLEEGGWRSASATFEEALSVRDLQESPYPFEFLASESLRGEKLPGRSGFVAALMSAVLPGAGQMYSGRFWDGFRAFTVNGLLIFSTYKLVEDEHYAGAYLLSGITLPFYVGNVVGARVAAKAYNVRQRSQFIDSLLSGSRPASQN